MKKKKKITIIMIIMFLLIIEIIYLIKEKNIIALKEIEEKRAIYEKEVIENFIYSFIYDKENLEKLEKFFESKGYKIPEEMYKFPMKTKIEIYTNMIITIIEEGIKFTIDSTSIMLWGKEIPLLKPVVYGIEIHFDIDENMNIYLRFWEDIKNTRETISSLEISTKIYYEKKLYPRIIIEKLASKELEDEIRELMIKFLINKEGIEEKELILEIIERTK